MAVSLGSFTNPLLATSGGGRLTLVGFGMRHGFSLGRCEPIDDSSRLAPFCIVVATIGRPQVRVASAESRDHKTVVETHVVSEALIFKGDHGALQRLHARRLAGEAGQFDFFAKPGRVIDGVGSPAAHPILADPIGSVLVAQPADYTRARAESFHCQA